MATLAEMKARLAAIKEKQNVQSPQAPAPAKAGQDSEAERTSIAVAVVLSESGEAHSPAAIETDLQPTTLVVVERPADVRIVDGESAGSDEPSTNLDTTNPVHQNFLQRLADLEAALLARDPLMKTHLGMIHKTMIEYEEIPNLLTVEEIRKIMEAQQAHTGVVLRTEVVKSSKAAATRKSAQIKLEDI